MSQLDIALAYAALDRIRDIEEQALRSGIGHNSESYAITCEALGVEPLCLHRGRKFIEKGATVCSDCGKSV